MVKAMEEVGGTRDTTIGEDLSSVWNDMGANYQNVVTAGGNLLSEGWDNVTSGVSSVFSGVGNIGNDLFSWVEGKVFFWLATFVVVIVILLKSGLLTQGADFARAISGV